MAEAVIRGVKVAVVSDTDLRGVLVCREDGEPMSEAESQSIINMILNRLDERPLAERARLSHYRCTSCEEIFDTRELLARHERGVHGKGLPMLDTPGEEPQPAA